jgi:hypothetical protein
MLRDRFRILAAMAALAAILAAGGLSSRAQPAQPSHPWLVKSPLSASFQMARAINAGILRPSTGGEAIQPPALKCKPRPCALPNVRASRGPQPVNQTPMAVDPNAGNLLTAGNDYNCPSLQGYYISVSGGASWSRSCGTVASGSTGGGGQPIVGWDLNEVAYRGGADMFSQSTSGIVVDKSTDLGATWSTPVIAARVFGLLMDKPWMEIDNNLASPFKNTIYVSATEVTNNNSNSRIAVTHSSDGGATWSLVNVDTLQIFPKVDQFSDLAITDDGTVYVSWMRCTASGPTNDCGGTTASMWFSKSTNQGVTWSAPTMINNVDLAPDDCGAFYGCLPNTSIPVSNVPVIAVDNSASPTHGNLYVIEYTWRGFYMKTQVTVSSNGGSVWGSPIRVTPSSDTHDQFFAWINVASNGTVGVSFLDRRNDQANIDYDAFSASSTNGGASYQDLQLSNVTSNPLNDGFGGSFLGESTGNGWGAGAKHMFAAWPDTRLGESQDEVGGLMP